MKIHFVKAGETLFEISKKYGVTVEEIMAANTSVTDPNTIMPGMKLIIPVKQQVPIPVDSIAPSSPHLHLNLPHIPVYPGQALSQAAPQLTPQLEPIPQITQQSTPQFIPQAPTGMVNQGFSYPGQAVPPFAAIPMPAQQVSAYASMPAVPAAWTMPPGYTAYNTPYHMTNYSAPNSYPNPAFQAMPQAHSNYQPYSTSMMQYPNNENYEYYNTYSALQSNAEWPSHNPQPHGQYNQPQTAQDIVQPQRNKQQDDIEEKSGQQESKKARTSSTSKESVPVKTKKNSLHEQIVRLQQTRNKVHQR
ncbi:MAG: LysM peptidoglycan-binding domain-containing protein [Paenibacillaceae bacterium]